MDDKQLAPSNFSRCFQIQKQGASILKSVSGLMGSSVRIAQTRIA